MGILGRTEGICLHQQLTQLGTYHKCFNQLMHRLGGSDGTVFPVGSLQPTSSSAIIVFDGNFPSGLVNPDRIEELHATLRHTLESCFSPAVSLNTELYENVMDHEFKLRSRISVRATLLREQLTTAPAADSIELFTPELWAKCVFPNTRDFKEDPHSQRCAEPRTKMLEQKIPAAIALKHVYEYLLDKLLLDPGDLPIEVRDRTGTDTLGQIVPYECFVWEFVIPMSVKPNFVTQVLIPGAQHLYSSGGVVYNHQGYPGERYTHVRRISVMMSRAAMRDLVTENSIIGIYKLIGVHLAEGLLCGKGTVAAFAEFIGGAPNGSIQHADGSRAPRTG